MDKEIKQKFNQKWAVLFGDSDTAVAARELFLEMVEDIINDKLK